MKTEEIRDKIHESIENIDDPEFLSIVQDMLNRKYPIAEPINPSPDLIAGLEKASQEIQSGEFLSDEQANAIIDEWLSA